ncbi:MAG: peptidoglycan-binding protein [Candidatus Omnitrophica bacterium]|nr:peptidoglycan-binding protein [Candidatus Omnitrophota bacterium]
MSRYRTGFFLYFLLFLCLSVCGCDALYRLLDKEGAEEKALVGDVIPFESNQTVEEVQTLLSVYGYSPGKIDGVLGLRTRNALEEFQKDNGLEPTRFVDQATWQKLNAFNKNGLIVEGQLNVRLIQTLLKKAGFNPGEIDGKLGQRTRNAVLAFQKAHQLKVDGKIGYRTLSRLSLFMKEEAQRP